MTHSELIVRHYYANGADVTRLVLSDESEWGGIIGGPPARTRWTMEAEVQLHCLMMEASPSLFYEFFETADGNGLIEWSARDVSLAVERDCPGLVQVYVKLEGKKKP